MKRICAAVLTVALLLCACGQKGPTWQEQYDLGIKYLSEGNYEEAIIAFTAAIEIDPKRAPAYVGRGDAYIGSGETEENLAAAQADYEQAIQLDETNAGAYLGLADVYIRRGEYDKALEILRTGLDKTGGDQSIADGLAEMESGAVTDSTGQVRRELEYRYDESGAVEWIHEYIYDSDGRKIRGNTYNANWVLSSYSITDWDENGRSWSFTVYDGDGKFLYHTVETREGNDHVFTDYTADGKMINKRIQRYDDGGNYIGMESYDSNGNLMHKSTG